MRHLALRPLVSFVLALSLVAPAWGQKDLSELSKGTPVHLQEGRFGSEQYVEFEAAKLANPKLVWVNIPLLREMGYEIPEVVDAATEKKILDALAWVAVDRNVPANEITGERRRLVADFYGGEGLGVNVGSARAASAGEIQIKGVGMTPHIRSYDAQHTARSTIHESIKDAVWGEVLNNELPFGANRIVAILERGGALEAGEPQALEIRLDPVRMGHFIPREYRSDNQDRARSAMSAEKLDRNLPEPPGGFPENATRGQKISLGMMEYSRRVGIQYGQMYMRRFFHGATSQSNIEISGRMIDFGTASALPAHQKAQFLAHVEGFGPTAEIENVLMEKFAKMLVLHPQLEAEMKSANSDSKNWRQNLAQKMVAQFKSEYQQERRRMALRMLGVPEALAAQLLPRHQSLADELIRLTEADLRTLPSIQLKSASSLQGMGRPSFQTLTEALHSQNSWEAKQLEHLLTETRVLDKISNSRIMVGSTRPRPEVVQMAQALESLWQDSARWAEQGGVSAENFRELMKANSLFLHRPVEELYLPELKKLTSAATRSYMEGLLGSPARLIQHLLANSYRSIQGLKWYEAPVRVLQEVDGKPRVQILDARTGQLRSLDYVPRDRHLMLEKQAPATRGAPACSKVFLAS